VDWVGVGENFCKNFHQHPPNPLRHNRSVTFVEAASQAISSYQMTLMTLMTE
jgi:hypothetical protein